MDRGGGGDDPPVSPVWQPRRRCWLVSPAFPATTGEWAGSPPLALPKERTSQVPGRKGCWELGGCLWACPPRGDRSPGSSCPPLQPPASDGLNSRAFLRKCLSWQQLQPTRARLLLTSRAWAGGERGGARAGRGRDLARGQTITLLLRWPDGELRLLPDLS